MRSIRLSQASSKRGDLLLLLDLVKSSSWSFQLLPLAALSRERTKTLSHTARGLRNARTVSSACGYPFGPLHWKLWARLSPLESVSSKRQPSSPI